MGSAQRAIHQQSINAKEEFWTEAAQELQWQQPFAKVLDDSNKPFYKWFVGGKLNTCFNALDYHVENGRGESCAIIYDSPVTNTKTSYTYNQLKHEVALFAGVLKNLNVNYGDRVVIYMPMIPQAVIAMLACARIGAIHSVVFGGFAGNELAKRIDDAKPKVVIAASCGIEVSRVIAYKPLLDEALQLAKHCVESCVVYQRKECQSELIEDRDYDWNTLLAQATEADCALIDANHPLYILYTSGTTGAPKGVVRDTAGHAVALKWSIKNIYNLSPGDVFWTASDVGWVVGHSYIVYAPLLAGCTTLLYEGKPVGTPDAGAFWRVIDEHKVNVMFTAPTAIRAIKREDSNGVLTKKYPMKSLRTLFLAGERCDPDTIEWSKKLLNVPVIDHWWQTETGWGIAANCLGIEQSPIKQGSPGQAVPGYDVEVLDEGGHQQAKGELGAIVIKLPLPPGCLTSLWNDDKRFIYSYLEKYDGYYLTGDAGYIDEDNYVWVMSRIDDVINVAGHRLSTGLLEETISAHKDVAECAVIGANDSLKGQLPLALVVLKNNVSSDEEDIKAEIVQDIRSKVGAVAALKKIAMVSTLPKTRSGKVLRGTMRNIANGEPPNPPATILNPESIDIVMAGLATLGYPEINKE